MTDSFRETIDEAGVALLTLDRPGRLNALTFEVYRELTDRIASFASEPAVRALVITGSDGAFCSGGDVHDIIGALFDRTEEQTLAFTRMTGELIANVRRLEKPVIAAVDGIAAGAGAVLALAADLRVLSERARFAFLFTKVGLTGADMGAGYLLPRIVGLGRATELLLLGDTIDAATAERYGLAHRVVPHEECLGTAIQIATRLARGPAAALATTKRLLDAEWTMGLETAIEAEAQAQKVHLRGEDHREFYQAFLAKRPPVFSGQRSATEGSPS